MAVHDNTYSRVVAWLKILLPLLALGILSTLFLVARAIDPAQDLPFADVDVDALANEQRIGNPNYSSVTEDGAAISVSALSARPDPGETKTVSGDQIKTGIDLPNGTRIDISALHMRLNHAAGTVSLSGHVVAETSDGYALQTETIEVALDRTRLSSDTPLQVSTPIGHLSADRFTLTKSTKTSSDYLLVFKGHVKLVYDPIK